MKNLLILCVMFGGCVTIKYNVYVTTKDVPSSTICGYAGTSSISINGEDYGCDYGRGFYYNTPVKPWIGVDSILNNNWPK